ncbi:MAG: hypothetical protein ACI8ZF_000880 [Candidatus Midichloriaceae bacterium]|jgi:hypothetical protein
MRYCLKIFFIFFGLLISINKSNAIDFRANDYNYCVSAVKYFEKKYNIPNNYLYYISKVESGKWNKYLKRLEPWPWAANVNGKSMFFKNKKEMVDTLRVHILNGEENIDIGCNQINYKYHKHHFKNLEQMATPHLNVEYSASYLFKNFTKTKNWHSAIAQYHSKNPKLGKLYINKIEKTAKNHNNQLLAFSKTNNKSANFLKKQIINNATPKKTSSKDNIMVFDIDKYSAQTDVILKIKKDL